MSEAGIRIEGLRKRVGKGDTAVDALKDVYVTVAPGEVAGLIGHAVSGTSVMRSTNAVMANIVPYAKRLRLNQDDVIPMTLPMAHQPGFRCRLMMPSRCGPVPCGSTSSSRRWPPS